jgi:hypothetical protein
MQLRLKRVSGLQMIPMIRLLQIKINCAGNTGALPSSKEIATQASSTTTLVLKQSLAWAWLKRMALSSILMVVRAALLSAACRCC